MAEPRKASRWARSADVTNVTELQPRSDSGKTDDQVPDSASDADPERRRGNPWAVVLAVVIALAIVCLIWLARR